MILQGLRRNLVEKIEAHGQKGEWTERRTWDGNGRYPDEKDKCRRGDEQPTLAVQLGAGSRVARREGVLVREETNQNVQHGRILAQKVHATQSVRTRQAEVPQVPAHRLCSTHKEQAEVYTMRNLAANILEWIYVM